MRVSIVIPAKNENTALSTLLPAVQSELEGVEIVLVDDGSSDSTSRVALDCGVRVVQHRYSKGNGAAIKTGARAATGDVIVFMDGDGQHDPKDIQRLLEELDEGYDMVVGARSGLSSQASVWRWSANALYNKLASWMVGHKIDDLTSGFRAVRREKFLQFLYLLPNGFSYPTTSTMAFFRAGHSVGFIPIEVSKRVGKSHINLWRDGIRFFLIIFKIGTLYSPLKIYFPVAVAMAGLGMFNYLYTAITTGALRFSNMSTLLFLSGMIVFLIGLLSEQLTNLQYKDSESDND